MQNSMVGQKIGRYRITEMLGQGGMGAVYRGYQEDLKRDVALKVISSGLSQQEEIVARFIREAQTAAALEHTHIVPIYDYGVIDNQLFIVMRLLTGGTLSDRIEAARRSGNKPSLGECASLLNQLASALDYAHNHGVVHRDIKPGNVMFDANGEAFLVDFGIAKVANSSALTAASAMIGSPSFMAPEQWRGEAITSATDQYAMAVVMYTMLTQRLPFEADTPYAMMNLHVSGDVPSLEEARGDVPAAVGHVLERGMAKKPGDRFPTMNAFAQAFQAAIGDGGRETTGFFSRPVPPRRISSTATTMDRGTGGATGPGNISQTLRQQRVGLAVGLGAGLVIALIAIVALVMQTLPRNDGDPTNTRGEITQSISATPNDVVGEPTSGGSVILLLTPNAATPAGDSSAEPTETGSGDASPSPASTRASTDESTPNQTPSTGVTPSGESTVEPEATQEVTSQSLLSVTNERTPVEPLLQESSTPTFTASPDATLTPSPTLTPSQSTTEIAAQTATELVRIAQEAGATLNAALTATAQAVTNTPTPDQTGTAAVTATRSAQQTATALIDAAASATAEEAQLLLTAQSAARSTIQSQQDGTSTAEAQATADASALLSAGTATQQAVLIQGTNVQSTADAQTQQAALTATRVAADALTAAAATEAAATFASQQQATQQAAFAQATSVAATDVARDAELAAAQGTLQAIYANSTAQADAATQSAQATADVATQVAEATAAESTRIAGVIAAALTAEANRPTATLTSTPLPTATPLVTVNPTFVARSGDCLVVTVVEGDSVLAIASANNVDIRDLLQANEMLRPQDTVLAVGQQLIVPVEGCTWYPSTGGGAEISPTVVTNVGAATPDAAVLVTSATASRVNVRACANIACSVVGNLGQVSAQVVARDGTNGSYWLQIELEDGALGWVRRDTVSVDSGSLNTIPVIASPAATRVPTSAPGSTTSASTGSGGSCTTLRFTEPVDGGKIYKTREVPVSWRGVSNAEGYRITVVNADDSSQVGDQVEVAGTASSVTVDLAEFPVFRMRFTIQSLRGGSVTCTASVTVSHW